ncbi:hypothetical protein Ahy_A06g030400 [Arachis hypogaea]|uniref:Protein FAR1-RELATED SEQUENCE n=1 Tax=Arachis hypogaea TaxID=3818 RepID=A0A445CW88_ARAHY|nr:hypothetical protein Ahy_A06g030400 [Arachis hypogaea]
MDDSTSDSQLNQSAVDFKTESNEVPDIFCAVDDQFIPKVGMTFKTLDDAAKFYKDYLKVADFSTRVRCTNKKENEIKNQLITCRVASFTSLLSRSSKMLKQHRELSMSVRRTIENNEEVGIRPSKTFQSFVAAAEGHRDLNIIEKDVRNYITREVRNISEQEDAKEFGKYLYNLVCGAFVGVNHHGQSTLLGCALMKNEEIESFKWYKGHAEIEQEMSQVVWNSHSKDSFDRNWNDFLLKYGLVKWLSDLYEDHHIWVPIYLDHHFWAGMRSTQKSESMHSFFNKFITRNSSLIQFVKQYDNCLGSREQAERGLDAAKFHTVIPCAIKSSIEAQFQHVYTHQKFREVQAQFRRKANCITRLTNSALGYSVYEVGEQVSSSIFNKFVVTYDSVVAQVERPMLIIRVNRDIVSSRTKRVKL